MAILFPQKYKRNSSKYHKEQTKQQYQNKNYQKDYTHWKRNIKVQRAKMKDPYQLLGIDPSSASQNDIKEAYRQFMRMNHPDVLSAKLNKKEITEKEYYEKEENVKKINSFYDQYR